MKTRSYNFYHLIYQTFIKKDWGSGRGVHSFTLFCSKINCGCKRLWVYPQFILEKKQQQQNKQQQQQKKL